MPGFSAGLPGREAGKVIAGDDVRDTIIVTTAGH
jgi:hypothetical protein